MFCQLNSNNNALIAIYNSQSYVDFQFYEAFYGLFPLYSILHLDIPLPRIISDLLTQFSYLHLL